MRETGEFYVLCAIRDDRNTVDTVVADMGFHEAYVIETMRSLWRRGYLDSDDGIHFRLGEGMRKMLA